MQSHAHKRRRTCDTVFVVASMLLAGGTVRADDYGAAQSGNWENPSTWISSGVGGTYPGSNDNAYIGSYYPTGAASTATVTLIQNESVSSLVLGLYQGDQGTLALNGNTLTASYISIGSQTLGGIGAINESGGGSFSTTSLQVCLGNTLTFGMSDVAQNVNVYGSVTTTATSNIAGNLYSSGALTLGADLNVGAGNIVFGSGTVNAQGHNISAYSIDIGGGGQFPILNNVGTITANTLDIAFGSLTLKTTDSITGSLSAGTDATVTINSALNLSGTLYVNTEGSLNAQGHSLTANDIELGYLGNGFGPTGTEWTLANRGAITTDTLGVSYGSLALTAADSVTGNLTVGTGGAVTLGANLNLSGNLNLGNYDFKEISGSPATLDMAGHNISANAIVLGVDGDTWSLLNPGVLTTNSLTVISGSLPQGGVYNIGALTLADNATLTTSSTTNITGSVTLETAAMLTLGAPLSLSGALTLTTNASLNAQGMAINASEISIGYSGSGAASLTNPGPINTTDLYIGNGSQLTLSSGSTVVSDLVYLAGTGTTLTVNQSNGQTTEFTLNGAYAGALVFDPGPSLILDLASSSSNDWIFRWLDPADGNWIGVIESDIASGDIVINAPGGYQVYDRDGYTYIGCAPGRIRARAVVDLHARSGLRFARRLEHLETQPGRLIPKYS